MNKIYLIILVFLTGCKSTQTLHFEPSKKLSKIEIQKFEHNERCTGTGTTSIELLIENKWVEVKSPIFYLAPGNWKFGLMQQYEYIKENKGCVTIVPSISLSAFGDNASIAIEVKKGRSYYIYYNEKENKFEIKEKM